MARTLEPWTDPRCYPGRTKGSTERICIYGNEGKTLVAEIHPLSNGHAEEAKANFGLLASAPELLEALREVMQWCTVDPMNEAARQKRMQAGYRAAAVISKATGND